MLLTCKCGATNRIPGASKTRVRCGRCQHVFTIGELLQAKHEEPPRHAAPSLPGSDGDVPATHACNDDENCAWEGYEDELDENGKCPECGKKVHTT